MWLLKNAMSDSKVNYYWLVLGDLVLVIKDNMKNIKIRKSWKEEKKKIQALFIFSESVYW